MEGKTRDRKKSTKNQKTKCLNLNTTAENSKNQFDCQAQNLHRNCILIHYISETQEEDSDYISLHSINQHSEVQLTEN